MGDINSAPIREPPIDPVPELEPDDGPQDIRYVAFRNLYASFGENTRSMSFCGQKQTTETYPKQFFFQTEPQAKRTGIVKYSAAKRNDSKMNFLVRWRTQRTLF